MRIVMLGPPGSGKGTQCAMLSRRLGVPQISTGEMFRDAVSRGDELGRKAKAFMDAGELVPDEIVLDMVRERISRSDALDGFLFDGFPRTVGQAETLSEMLDKQGKQIDMVFWLSVPEEENVRRLSGRRVCSKCGAVYHLIYNPPPEGGGCEAGGECELIQRGDDKEEVVIERLRVYKRQTSPLIEFYKHTGRLVTIDGVGTVKEVFERLTEVV